MLEHSKPKACLTDTDVRACSLYLGQVFASCFRVIFSTLAFIFLTITKKVMDYVVWRVTGSKQGETPTAKFAYQVSDASFTCPH